MKEQTYTDRSGRPYQAVENDPAGVRIYTLENGLKIYLAKNNDAPRIQTYIAVNSGSNDDPASHTGLAHYLEHMMFKGSAALGTLDWKKEKPLLDEIEALYEAHSLEQDPLQKKEIFRKIDTLSQQAAVYALPNEYDKIMSALGASGTNAHTWLNETIYKNNIPSTELKRWLMVEKERFSNIAIRLFHTELETVYEEFNAGQDNDSRLMHETMMRALFPTHPNGQQTTIGRPEHLKNPSIRAIKTYFKENYVPNNMAVILVGDLDFEEAVEAVAESFGTLKPNWNLTKKSVSEAPQEAHSETVMTPSSPCLQIAWRTGPAGSRDAMIASLICELLTNSGETGLLDLNINQKQKATRALAYTLGYQDYSSLNLFIIPKENQNLQEAKTLLLNEVENIKSGNFPDWMPEAIINDYKLQRIKTFENADGLATTLYSVFIQGRSWLEELETLDEAAAITKGEICAYAKEKLGDNACIIFKEQGENKNLVRVENPGITPLKINREGQSEFFKNLLQIETPELQPEFMDFSKHITISRLAGRDFYFIRNASNEYAKLSFIFPVGTEDDKDYKIAFPFFEYLGTHKDSPEAIRNELYKRGLSYRYMTSKDQIIVSLSGLEENLIDGIAFYFEWLRNAYADPEIYADFIDTVQSERSFMKNDKNTIKKALQYYIKYGPDNTFRNIHSIQELIDTDPAYWTEKLISLFSSAFDIFYYGRDTASLAEALQPHLKAEYQSLENKRKKNEYFPDGGLYFTPYDMVQVEMMGAAVGDEVDTDTFACISVFNEYFGRGLSSIVFQELRESRSLAYSAGVQYFYAETTGKRDSIQYYIGTQPDKLQVALSSLEELIRDMPYAQEQFDNARISALKIMASARYTRSNIFFRYYAQKKLGLEGDIREKVYRSVENMNWETFYTFYKEKIQSAVFSTGLIGSNDAVRNFAQKENLQITELSREELFNY